MNKDKITLSPTLSIECEIQGHDRIISRLDWYYIKAVLEGKEEPPQSMMESLRQMKKDGLL